MVSSLIVPSVIDFTETNGDFLVSDDQGNQRVTHLADGQVLQGLVFMIGFVAFCVVAQKIAQWLEQI